MRDTQKWKVGLGLGIIYGLLLAATLFIPGSEIITFFMLPIPFIIYTSRYGYRSGLQFGTFVLIVSVFATLFLVIVTLPLTILAISTGIFIGYAIHQKRHPYETWALGSLGVTIGLVMLFVMIQVFSQVDFINQYESVIQESIQASKAMMESTGLQISQEDLDVIEQQMMNLITLLPSIVVLVAIVIAFVTQWLSYQLINWRKGRQLTFPKFRTFRLPKTVIWIFFVAVLFTWFPMDGTSSLAAGVMNVTTLIGTLLSIQGVSFILYYCHQKKLSIAFPILIIIFSLIFLPVGLYLTRILGIIDIGFDLRERMKQTK